MAVKEGKPAVTKRRTKAEKASPEGKPAEKVLRITLVRSLIGWTERQRQVARGLGLRKVNSEVIRKDSPEIRGMIRKIAHLVKVEAIEEK